MRMPGQSLYVVLIPVVLYAVAPACVLPEYTERTGGGTGGTASTKTGGTKTVAATGGSVSAGGPVYTNDIATFLKTTCVACHFQGGVAPTLDAYATAKSNAAAANTSIQAGTMPPSRTLTAAEKSRFDTWVKNGAPL